MKETTLRINAARLMQSIEASALVGALSNGGIRRLALTDEDRLMREMFVQWLQEAGLQVRVDDFGNIYGRKEGRDSDAPPVLIGSHLDTQPEGGRYDGILGVLGGLEVLRCLQDNEVVCDRPIELICFTNEEGSRFEPPILGAGGLSGRFDQAFIYSRKDAEGKSFIEELKRIGYCGEEKSRVTNPYCYLELHIEQGPVLEHEHLDIGIVTGIQGMDWLEIKITGQSDHAGPTPMDMRKDALYASSKLIKQIIETTRQFNEEATATIGRMALKPNSINCVPGEVTFSVDLRHSDDTTKKRLTELIIEKASVMAAAEKVSIETKKIWESNATHFSEDLIETIDESVQELGYRSRKMISGAGHDAKYMNDLTPAAMIFVPSKDGKSHCQEEYTEPKYIEKGANVLLQTVLKAAQMN